MKLLTEWIRSYVPGLTAGDHELAEALTLRGIAVDGVYDLGPGRGSLLEMDITTNRVDAMNHYGVAREAAAIYNLHLAPLETGLPTAARGKPVSVRIEAPDLCGRFTARVLSDVAIQPSSGAVHDRFALLDQKPIVNAVDATNYVVLAMGHPTHAFDYDKLEGGIVVRRARRGETLKTLDGVVRSLDPEDLVIADEQKPVSLAGLMGGWDTMITPETKRILVEAAWFDPASIRRTSRRHGLHTEASHRFERGADFNAAPAASALVSRLLLQAGGQISGKLVDVIRPEIEARTAGRPPIQLRYQQIGRILGEAPGAGSGQTPDGAGITTARVHSMLTLLGCTIEEASADACSVRLPSWRLDLEREIDLLEEIARVYGYNQFPNTLPAFSGIVVQPPHLAKEAAVRQALLASGWNEAISSSFCSSSDASLFSAKPGSAVAVGNPLSEEAGMLRPSLVPGVLTMLSNNLSRGVENVRLFEMGTCFSGSTTAVDERPTLALGAVGRDVRGPFLPSHPIDFYDLKGLLEAVLARFDSPSLSIEASSAGDVPVWLHPYRSARIVLSGSTLGWIGQLSPQEARSRKIRQAVYIGEIHLDELYQLLLHRPAAREISRFQPVERDFSFRFPHTVSWSRIAASIDQLDLKEIVHYDPSEVLRDGAGAADGQYSILISVTFQALDRTLRDEELKRYSTSIIQSLENLGGALRA